jgi:hypothetical protein
MCSPCENTPPIRKGFLWRGDGSETPKVRRTYVGFRTEEVDKMLQASEKSVWFASRWEQEEEGGIWDVGVVWFLVPLCLHAVTSLCLCLLIWGTRNVHGGSHHELHHVSRANHYKSTVTPQMMMSSMNSGKEQNHFRWVSEARHDRTQSPPNQECVSYISIEGTSPELSQDTNCQGKPGEQVGRPFNCICMNKFVRGLPFVRNKWECSWCWESDFLLGGVAAPSKGSSDGQAQWPQETEVRAQSLSTINHLLRVLHWAGASKNPGNVTHENSDLLKTYRKQRPRI